MTVFDKIMLSLKTFNTYTMVTCTLVHVSVTESNGCHDSFYKHDQV